LWEVARALSSEPLVLAAARLLDRAPSDIAIVTGAAVPGHMPVGENDGPFGSVVLATALVRIGHKVTIYTDPDALPPIAMLAKRAGLAIDVLPLTLGDTDQQVKIAEKHDLFVAIERLGGNRNGQIYGVTGVSRSPSNHADHTMASTTPCGGGVFSVVPTDVLAVGTSSNIGAYGVVAALALLKRDASLCHTPEEEVALHHVGVGLGLVDGGGGDRIPWCDGIPADANAALVRLMQNIVERTLEPPRVRKF